jgi:hypothetical protein
MRLLALAALLWSCNASWLTIAAADYEKRKTNVCAYYTEKGYPPKGVYYEQVTHTGLYDGLFAFKVNEFSKNNPWCIKKYKWESSTNTYTNQGMDFECNCAYFL